MSPACMRSAGAIASRLAKVSKHRIGLREGILSTYQWFLTHRAELRGVSITTS